ncbi:hypothetical protein BDZ89DRAFT_1076143, partial [Hymenopellis radicata]
PLQLLVAPAHHRPAASHGMDTKTSFSYAGALRHASRPTPHRAKPSRASGSALAPAPPSSTPTKQTLPCQAIAKVDASLIIPYYELCLFAEENRLSSQDGQPNDSMCPLDADSTWQSVSYRKLPRPESLQSHLTRAIATIKTAVALREGKGGRPGIVCKAPAKWKGSVHNSWIFPMGTFDGHNEETLPEVLRAFTIPVLQSSSKRDTGHYVRTTPTWRMRKRLESGESPTQWVVAIPLMMSDGSHPTEAWAEDRQGNPQDKMEEFMCDASTKPGYLEEFVRRLEQNESEVSSSVLLKTTIDFDYTQHHIKLVPNVDYQFQEPTNRL